MVLILLEVNLMRFSFGTKRGDKVLEIIGKVI